MYSCLHIITFYFLGVEEFLLYSINWEIKGLSLAPEDNETQVLGPISRVSMATSIDYHAGMRL